jgi:hypothetical protein
VSANGTGKITNAVSASNAISVEMWVSPADVARLDSMMLGISANRNARNFAFLQQGATLESYLRSTATGTRGEPPTTAANALQAQMMHLVFTRDAAGFTKVYVNGALVAEGFVAGGLGNWVASHRLHLGGERDGSRSWLGTYYLLAIYNRALTPAEVVQNFAYGDV